MAEQHHPLQGYPTGLLQLIIDRVANEEIEVDVTFDKDGELELEILHATHVNGEAEAQKMSSVVLHKTEARMLRDFLNSGIVVTWLEQEC